MAEVTKSVTLDARREAVWATLTAFDRIAEWAEDVDHSSLLTDQASGVGTTRRIQQGANAITETIVNWQEPTCLAYRVDGLPPIFRQVINQWDLTEEGERTQANLTVQVTATRPPAAIAAQIVARAIGRVNARILDGLQVEMELTQAP
ncbi:MAG: SRPBCC family protein [Actinomycetota bacterium]|nr:SRPBCC family protein [Actinomycetota bacterium]